MASTFSQASDYRRVHVFPKEDGSVRIVEEAAGPAALLAFGCERCSQAVVLSPHVCVHMKAVSFDVDEPGAARTWFKEHYLSDLMDALDRAHLPYTYTVDLPELALVRPA